MEPTPNFQRGRRPRLEAPGTQHSQLGPALGTKGAPGIDWLPAIGAVGRRRQVHGPASCLLELGPKGRVEVVEVARMQGDEPYAVPMIPRHLPPHAPFVP